MAHVFLGPESAQNENSSLFPMFLLKNSTKIAQNLNFTQAFPRFFPQALLCGFSKLQLQTQATAQVGKSHSGRSCVQILLGPVLDLVPDEFTVNNGQRWLLLSESQVLLTGNTSSVVYHMFPWPLRQHDCTSLQQGLSGDTWWQQPKGPQTGGKGENR